MKTGVVEAQAQVSLCSNCCSLIIDTMSMIWINVRLMGGEHLANVEVLFEDLQTTTALMLKEKVYEACGIPIAQQTLFNSAGARVSDAGPLFADSLGLFQSRYLQFVVGAADILPAGLESSCGVMSSSEPEDEPEAESKPKPKPRHFKPEVLETEDVQDGWRGYYERALRGLEGYEPRYPGLEGTAILDDEDRQHLTLHNF